MRRRCANAEVHTFSLEARRDLPAFGNGALRESCFRCAKHGLVNVTPACAPLRQPCRRPGILPLPSATTPTEARQTSPGGTPPLWDCSFRKYAFLGCNFSSAPPVPRSCSSPGSSPPPTPRGGGRRARARFYRQGLHATTSVRIRISISASIGMTISSATLRVDC